MLPPSGSVVVVKRWLSFQEHAKNSNIPFKSKRDIGLELSQMYRIVL